MSLCFVVSLSQSNLVLLALHRNSLLISDLLTFIQGDDWFWQFLNIKNLLGDFVFQYWRLALIWYLSVVLCEWISHLISWLHLIIIIFTSLTEYSATSQYLFWVDLWYSLYLLTQQVLFTFIYRLHLENQWLFLNLYFWHCMICYSSCDLAFTQTEFHQGALTKNLVGLLFF